MKVSYSEGLANHTGSESCGVAREGGCEALTGEGTGRVFSREKTNPPGRRRRKERRKAASYAPILRGAYESRVVTDPAHVPKHLAREPGGPAFSQGGRHSGTHREV